MTRISVTALGVVMVLGACTPPEITSRLDTSDTLNTGFSKAEAYTPSPVGARAQNDFMRFSTQGVPQ